MYTVMNVHGAHCTLYNAMNLGTSTFYLSNRNTANTWNPTVIKQDHMNDFLSLIKISFGVIVYYV